MGVFFGGHDVSNLHCAFYDAVTSRAHSKCARTYNHNERLTCDDVTCDDVARDDVTRDDVTRDVTHDDVTRDDVTRDDVTRDDVTRDDVTRDDVTRNDVTRDDVTRDDVTRDDVMRDDVTRDDVARDDVTRNSVSRGSRQSCATTDLSAVDRRKHYLQFALFNDQHAGSIVQLDQRSYNFIEVRLIVIIVGWISSHIDSDTAPAPCSNARV